MESQIKVGQLNDSFIKIVLNESSSRKRYHQYSASHMISPISYCPSDIGEGWFGML